MDRDKNKDHLITENLTDAYSLQQLVTDSEGKPVDYIFLEVNKAFEEMTGLTGKNIIGKKVTEVLPGIEKSKFDWIAFYGEVVLTGKTAYFEQYAEPLDRYYEVTAYRVDDQHFSTIFSDVTDRKVKEMKEKAVRVSQRLAQNVLDAMNANICVLDEHGYILSVNQSWLDFAKLNDGKTEAVGPGVNYLEVCDKAEGEEREMAEKFAAGIRELIQGHRDKFSMEYFSDAPGKKKWFLAEATSFLDMSLNSQFVVITHTDITEHKQNERLLQARLDLLEFSTNHDLDATLQRILDEACAMVDSPIGFYDFINSDREEITVKAWSTATLEEFCAIGSLSGKKYSVAEAGVWADSIHEKEPLIHNDYYSLPHRKGLPDGHAEIIRELVVPIIRGDKTVAILAVGNKPKDYNEHDVSIVAFFADLAWEIGKKKQAEESLAASEEKHRRLFETMAQGVTYQAADGEIISANPAAEEILGLSFEQMQGKTSMDPRWQMIEEDGTPVAGSDHPTMIALRTKEKVGPVTRGVFHPHKNSHVWLSITATPLFQPGETEPSQVYVTFSDVTARKQAEEALLEKQQFDNLQAEIAEVFLNVYEQDPGYAFNKVLQCTGEFFAADCCYLFELSPGGAKMVNTYQWSNQEKAGQTEPPIIFPIKDLPWAYEQINREGYLHIPDVEQMPPEASAEKDLFKGLQFKSVLVVTLFVQDEPYGLLAFATVNDKKSWNDEQIRNIRAIGEKITTVILRKRLLKQKEDAYEKALAVLDSIDALIYVADMETYEILYINRFGLEVWGDVEGKKCWEVLQKNQTGPCEFCTNHKLLDENGQSTGIHKWQIKNTMNSRWYEASDQAIRWIDDKMKRLSVAVDVTRLKEAEQKAEEAHRAKSKFLATMSHEIRTPLNVIIGMTNLLNEAGLEEPYYEYACMSNESAEHLLEIINDILDFSRIEADQIEIMPGRIKLVQEVGKIVSVFNNQATLKGLKLLHHCDEQLPEKVVIDLVRLKQVLINLIGNAIKFTEKGTVELLVWLKEGNSRAIKEPENRQEIAFAVKDTGPGIAEKDKDKLFESFSQVGQSKYQGSGGTGLGLAISKNLVELMGGRLWLESEPGKGSTFYFTLPCTVPEKTEAEAEEERTGKTDVEKEGEKKALTLLLAEDKPMNQKMAKVFLEQMGHKVEIVANGKKAVEAVKSHRYDAVLMDINMPEMDGLEATRKIRAWEKESGRCRTAIIAMTAYAMKGDREEFLNAGMDDYIPKPIKKEALADSLWQLQRDE